MAFPFVFIWAKCQNPVVLVRIDVPDSTIACRQQFGRIHTGLIRNQNGLPFTSRRQFTANKGAANDVAGGGADKVDGIPRSPTQAANSRCQSGGIAVKDFFSFKVFKYSQIRTDPEPIRPRNSQFGPTDRLIEGPYRILFVINNFGYPVGL